MAAKRLTADAYTVALIYAKPLELHAISVMLDEHHESVPLHHSHTNEYKLGRIGNHNVAIAGPSRGAQGKAAIATVVSQIRFAFPNISVGLLVGIGGGVPRLPEHDVRLGDVVIGAPEVGPAVVQYDFGKQLEDTIEVTRTLNKPPELLLKVVNILDDKYHTTEEGAEDFFARHLRRFAKFPKLKHRFKRPEMRDRLFQADYNHELGSLCSSHGICYEIERPDRPPDDILIHYSTILSGDLVMKSATRRDELSTKHNNALCFEMEAAGLMDVFPCLVIRGICDYSDSHKTKEWQEYAAAVAGAYARELLLNMAERIESQLHAAASQEPEAIKSLPLRLDVPYPPPSYPHSDTETQGPAGSKPKTDELRPNEPAIIFAEEADMSENPRLSRRSRYERRADEREDNIREEYNENFQQRPIRDTRIRSQSYNRSHNRKDPSQLSKSPRAYTDSDDEGRNLATRSRKIKTAPRPSPTVVTRSYTFWDDGEASSMGRATPLVETRHYVFDTPPEESKSKGDTTRPRVVIRRNVYPSEEELGSRSKSTRPVSWKSGLSESFEPPSVRSPTQQRHQNSILSSDFASTNREVRYEHTRQPTVQREAAQAGSEDAASFARKLKAINSLDEGVEFFRRLLRWDVVAEKGISTITSSRGGTKTDSASECSDTGSVDTIAKEYTRTANDLENQDQLALEIGRWTSSLCRWREARDAAFAWVEGMRLQPSSISVRSARSAQQRSLRLESDLMDSLVTLRVKRVEAGSISEENQLSKAALGILSALAALRVEKETIEDLLRNEFSPDEDILENLRCTLSSGPDSEDDEEDAQRKTLDNRAAYFEDDPPWKEEFSDWNQWFISRDKRRYHR